MILSDFGFGFGANVENLLIPQTSLRNDGA
jgi:hypothetical protein